MAFIMDEATFYPWRTSRSLVIHHHHRLISLCNRYIDYKHFVDVVKYRLFLMSNYLRESEQLEIERQTFRCSNDDCGREYTALEAQLLLTPGVYEFHCGHCNSKLVEVLRMMMMMMMG